MFKKLFVTLATLVMLFSSSLTVQGSMFTPYYDENCKYFMTLDYENPVVCTTGKTFFIQNTVTTAGRTYMKNDGSLWRKNNVTSFEIFLYNPGEILPSYVCPELEFEDTVLPPSTC